MFSVEIECALHGPAFGATATELVVVSPCSMHGLAAACHSESGAVAARHRALPRQRTDRQLGSQFQRADRSHAIGSLRATAQTGATRPPLPDKT
jgi:hypothetical protein